MDKKGSAMSAALLEVQGLHKSFGGVQAVADVSFAVDAGELLALIGPNGAGKSTCFNMLNGQLAPDAGIVRLGGRDIVGLRPTMSRPSRRTMPPSGASWPFSMLKQVLLPAPLGPIRAKSSPASTAKETSATACTPPNDLCRPST